MNDASVFAALADPMRRQLLVNLAKNSPKTATQLAQEYPITRQGVLKHLNILEDAGLITFYKEKRDKQYVLTPQPLNDLGKWVQDLIAIWDARLLNLKNFIENDPEPE